MATATVDTISYLNTAPEKSTPKQNSDSSNTFEKVFSNVNKSYNDNDNSSKSTDSGTRNNAVDNQNQPKQKVDNNQKQNNDDNNQKIDNKNNEQDAQIQAKQDEKNLKEQNAQDKIDSRNSDNSKQKTEQKDSGENKDQVTQNTSVQADTKVAEQVNTQLNPQVDTVKVEVPVQNVLPDNTVINSQAENTQTQQNDAENSTTTAQVVSNAQDANISQANQNQNKNTQTNTKTQKAVNNEQQTVIVNPNTKQVGQQNNTTEQVSVQSQTDVSVQNQSPTQTQTGVSQSLPQEQNGNQVGSNNQQVLPTQNDTKDLIQQATIQESALPKNQTSGQVSGAASGQNSGNSVGQISDLIKAATIKDLAQPQNQAQQTQQTPVSQDIPQENQEISVETPVIATNLATANKNVNQNNTDNSTSDVAAKSQLTQEMIDKTNAKIVNVESSGSKSSNSDLLSKQSPQEQLVKLSLNSDTKTETQNSSLPNIADTNIQVTVDKTINNVQNQTSKELSKTDILSQIHNQLDKFGQDEGTTKVTIVLKPENLGRISLELVNSKDGLTAKMTTDNAQVKELLDKNLNGLKDTIGSQGVNVSNVSVKLENTQHQSNNEFAYEEHQDRGNQQQSNNPQNKDENESKFANEMNNKMNSENEDEETSYKSEINYKV